MSGAAPRERSHRPVVAPGHVPRRGTRAFAAEHLGKAKAQGRIGPGHAGRHMPRPGGPGTDRRRGQTPEAATARAQDRPPFGMAVDATRGERKNVRTPSVGREGSDADGVRSPDENALGLGVRTCSRTARGRVRWRRRDTRQPGANLRRDVTPRAPPGRGLAPARPRVPGTVVAERRRVRNPPTHDPSRPVRDRSFGPGQDRGSIDFLAERERGPETMERPGERAEAAERCRGTRTS